MVDDWQMDAANGKPMPKNLPLSEQKAFQALSLLYVRFRMGGVEKEQAADEKRKILNQLQREIKAENFSDRLTFHHEQVIRATSAARCRMRKEQTVDAGNALCDALDGCGDFDPREAAFFDAGGALCPSCDNLLGSIESAVKINFCPICGRKLSIPEGADKK